MRVVYVSYDGALDPLGASQVVPYLLGLADRGFAITLISFEKPERWRQASLRIATQHRLDARRVRWKPLPYHRRPRLPATLWDVLVGSQAIAYEARRSAPALIHCRGDIAMLMARWAGLPSGTRLLYDVRGFFSDERVEIGSWRRRSVIDRLVRRAEAENLRRAHGVVVLTKPAASTVLRCRPSLASYRVIPTCVDVSVFRPRAPEEELKFGLVYSGSLGSWYMTKEMIAFARSAARFVPGTTLFLTPQLEDAWKFGATTDWAEVRTVEPDGVASWLRLGRALFFFIRPIPSKRASCPTKLAEGLASGLPIVCNRGIGDLDEVVEREDVGVLVDSFSDRAYADAGRRLQRLLQDPNLADRCRRLAETRYSLDLGTESYCQLYRELCADAMDQIEGRRLEIRERG
jgi:glycosyltransferase involved in cell wall biosynthesis